MKLVVGLGNPGKKYQNTRHNIGFMFLDYLANDYKWNVSKKGKLKYVWNKIGEEDVELLKPMTFMNNSGLAVAYVKKNHAKLNLTDIYLIHDDLDLSLGEYKMQFAKGPKKHNGLISVREHLKSNGFWHIRIGVRGDDYNIIKESSDKNMADDYLLKTFAKKELAVLLKIMLKIKEDLKKHFLN